MSTASPLPLQPVPPGLLSPGEAHTRKQEAALRLAEHRKRRPQTADQATLPLEQLANSPRHHIASSVAARFSRRESYRDFLQHEAEAAMHHAAAEAEVARRTAEAVVAAQQQLLHELEHWDAQPVGEDNPAVAAAADALPAAAQASALPATDHVPAPVVLAPAADEPQPGPMPQQPSVTQLLQQTAEPLEPAVALPTNLIEFPRQLVAARRARPRLAEGPLRDEADAAPGKAQLRIFEVEASSVSTTPAVESVLPEWHTIRLDAAEPSRDTAHPAAEITFALPLYVAPASQRAMATLVDGCCVLSAFLSAVAAAAYLSPALPTGLPALGAAAVLLAFLWLLYQVLFFACSNATPGMRYARIGLCTFGDDNPTRAGALRRIGARLLAGMPLGLGLLWACLDDEGLGWHDRISRMYPRAY